MKAIILAAGKGTRLNGAAIKPKCLMQIGGTTLLQKQVASLQSEGIRDIVIVVGFGADEVRSHFPGLTFVENGKYEETSSMYSLWLARDHMHDGFVVLNSDVLFHPRLLRRLLASTHPDALLLDYRSKSMDPMGDEEMKVQVKAGRVVDISKELDPQGADGENVGIVKFSSKGAETLIRCMDRLIQEGRVREWAPRAFLEFTGERDLYVIGTDGDPWIEIDFPEDFEKALADIYPKIEANQ